MQWAGEYSGTAFCDRVNGEPHRTPSEKLTAHHEAIISDRSG